MSCANSLFILMSLGVASACRFDLPATPPEGPGGSPCEAAGDCRAPTPVCKADTMTCVECMANTDCAAARPICGEQNTCLVCEKHSDCASGLCVDQVACADPADVAYVGGPNASNNPMCAKDMPCQMLSQALAVTPPRKYIKATGTIFEDVRIGSRAVAIFGEPGMTIIQSGYAYVFDIVNGANVDLRDLEIVSTSSGDGLSLRNLPPSMLSLTRVKVRAPGGAGILVSDGMLVLTDSDVYGSGTGVDLQKGSLVMNGSRATDNMQEGVRAGSGTTVEIRRSTISKNRGNAGVYAYNAAMTTIESSVITANTGTNGGVSINGPFTMRNNIIAANGTATSTIGGLTLSSTSAVFEFNTVANNISSGSGAGMSCATPIGVSNSILSGNKVNGCTVTYSLADTLLAGTGNKTGAPMFLSTDAANPASPMFYRIGAASAARDSAGPATIVDDIDGDPRPATGKDMGADEYK